MSGMKCEIQPSHTRLRLDHVSPLFQAICAISCFLIMTPVIQPGTESSHTPKVATITQIVGRVYRLAQSQASQNWVEIRSGTRLHQGDLIHTSNKSRALIRLGDKTELWVNPKTTLRISTASDFSKLDIKNGSVYANVVQHDRLYINNKDVLIARENSQVLLSHPQSSLKNIGVTEGSLVVFSRDKGEYISILKKVKKSEVGSNWMLAHEPRPGHAQHFGQTYTNNLFHWKSDLDDMDWTFQISYDEQFENPIYSYPLGENSDLELQLPKGKWFWRIAGRRHFTDSYYYSRTRHVEIHTEAPIRLPASEFKRITISPYEIHIVPFQEYQLSRVSWKFDPGKKHHFHLKTACKNPNSNFEAFANQPFLFTDLRQSLGCSIKIRHKDMKSAWSKPVKITSHHIKKQ